MIRTWMSLLRLACRRSRSGDDYRRFQIFQGRRILDYLLDQGVDIQNAQVLDLGCGRGGYSHVLVEAGANVTSVDLRPQEGLPSAFAVADATRIPFESGVFSFVFCASLIEHVPDATQLLVEIVRVLTGDGVAYLSFPPFYSPVGGHHLKPFHLLGERWALRLSKYKAESYATACGAWGLYPLSIHRARRLIVESGLKIRHESTRFLPLNLARIPWLGEFLTWHVQFVLCKCA